MPLRDAQLDAAAVATGEQLIRFENDLVVDCRLYFDTVETLEQLGMMPIPVKR